jgi:hypothetical protein
MSTYDHQPTKETEMDMRKYSGANFLKVDDVRDAPLREIIANIKVGKYDKPDMYFESGDCLSLNATNTHALIRAYGPNSDDWIGKEIELFVGEIEFENKPIDAVLVKAISPAPKQQERTNPPPAHDQMDDSIPF